MIKRILDRYIYFTIVVGFLLMSGALILLYPQGRSFFILNGLHFPILDSVFPTITHLGDGITSIIISVLLLIFYNLGAGIFSLLGAGICGIISYTMKYYLFALSQRPHHFFWGNKMIHYVDGVKINIENSFPSGHSLTAFFIFTFVALLSFAKPNFIQFLLAFLAVAAAYSRVYLAQHFVGDIFTGAIIGITVSVIFYKFYTKSKNIPILNKNIIRLLKK